MKKSSWFKKEVRITAGGIFLAAVVIFLLSGIASGFFINHILPRLNSVPGFRFLAPRFTVVVNRTEQVRVNDSIETRQVYDQLRTSTVTIVSTLAGSTPRTGTGVIATADGLIFTSKAIITDPQSQVSVFLSNGDEYSAQVLAFDSMSDVALIAINASGLPVAAFVDPGSYLLGEKFVSVGPSLTSFENPLAETMLASHADSLAQYPQTMSSAKLSSFISVEPSLLPGYEGAGIMDNERRIVGLVTAAGIVPGDYLEHSLARYTQTRNLTHPAFQFSYRPHSAALAQTLNLPNKAGLLLESSLGSLVVGDYLVAINETPVFGSNSLTQAILSILPGQQVTLEFYRNGQQQTATLTLE